MSKHFRARFPQHDGPADEPCQDHYLNAARFLRRMARPQNNFAILEHAAKFARVARRYGWMPKRREASGQEAERAK